MGFRTAAQVALLLVVVGGSLPSFGAAQETAPAPTVDRPAAIEGILLEIRVGDRTKRFGPLKVDETITVETLLRRIAESDSTFLFTSRGKGETFFVTGIDGHENEGRGGRNWFFLVDDKLGDRGAGSFEVTSGRTVRWEYRDGGLDR